MRRKIIFCTLLIITIAFPIASATEWDSATFTLSMENPVVSKGDYTINVVEFDGYGMVALNVYCNGLFIGNTVLMNNDSNWFYMDNEKIRFKGINVTDQRILPMCGNVHSPQAEIMFATEKSSKDSRFMALSISTDKDEYLTDDQVITTMQIRNIGEVKVDDIHLNVDTDGLVDQVDLPSGFSLEDGTYRSEEIKLRFPATLHKGFYNISVNMSWTNAHGVQDFLTESDSISITQPIEIYKSITNEVSLGQTVYTSISVENIQSRPVRIRLDDVLPMFFTLIDGTVTDNKQDLNWNFILAPHERKVVSYQMIPEQVGAHRVPDAHVTWNLWGTNYTNSSDSDNVIAVYQGVSFLEKDFPEPSPTPDDVIVGNNENSPEILMSVTIRSAISTKVTPDKLDFGKLAPGDTSERSDITIKNYGSCKILVTANVAETGDLHKQGLGIDGNSLESFNVTVVKNIVKNPYVSLNVPEQMKEWEVKRGR
ncbi:MAG: hypothetical protein HF976_03925 [ANME-2 cluster archaeon]|nr:hypothetical protein [ANME-2 cluster archaeon]MBC2700554.1 hypothetical protein [ANME-2 cluster archaeon]MBC2706746.1 hypothetical protein [ANME-2 cluster archaeon]MBC2748059.1 hypothetical protein [ANME-2 cluster archaeon]